MSQVINTNIGALNAQRNLNKSQMSQMTAMQRLSSGLRINSAKDDAAGLAISERMTSQINGLNQAARNANDGISIAQVAEGGLSEISNLLQQMRELAVQAANDANSDLDRASIQNSVQSLYDEIDRISATTDFNGTKLFTGAAANTTRNIQVGSNANQSIAFTIGQTDTKTLALNSSVAAGQTFSARVATTIATSTDLVINGIAVTSTVGAGVTNSANIAGQELAINNASATSGVTADAFNKLTGAQATVDSSHVVTGLIINVGNATGTVGANVTIDSAMSLSQLADNINRQVGGINAAIGSDGNLVLTNENGATIVVTGTTSNSGLTAGVYHGFIALKSADGSDIKITTGKLGGSATGVQNDQTVLAKFGFVESSGNGTVVGDGKLQTVTTATSAATAATLLDTLAGIYDVSVTATDVVKINGVTVGASQSGSAADKASAINAIADSTNVKATAETVAYVSINAAKLSSTNALSINGMSIQLTAVHTSLADVITKINTSGISGIKASADAVTGLLVLTSDSGLDIMVGDENASGTLGGQLVTNIRDGSATAASIQITTSNVIGVRGKITLSSTNGGSIRIDGDGSATNGTGLAKFGLVARNSDDIVIGSGLSVTTAAGANAAITAIDNAINAITTKRAALGSVQNRFQSVISTLQVSSENMSASRSRIQDADFASETANLSRAQILQQAGMAMLAQANQSSQGVLSLLR